MPDQFPASAADRLRSAPFTYSPVGATPEPQPEQRNFSRRRTLDRTDFVGAVDDLLTWRVHERAGLHVRSSDRRIVPGTVVEMTLGLGRVGARIPCRVVHVIEQPDRAGFAYGTLPGHPVSGEELFLVEHQTDGTLTFTITAFSRPATIVTRWGAPVTSGVQGWMTERYLRAIDRA